MLWGLVPTIQGSGQHVSVGRTFGPFQKYSPGSPQDCLVLATGETGVTQVVPEQVCHPVLPQAAQRGRRDSWSPHPTWVSREGSQREVTSERRLEASGGISQMKGQQVLEWVEAGGARYWSFVF